MHRRTVTLQNPRDPTSRLKLEAFGNPGRTEPHKKENQSQPRRFSQRIRKVRRVEYSNFSNKKSDGDCKNEAKHAGIQKKERRNKRVVLRKEVTHQNTVCLRVSQLEGVAATATRPNTLKKRMTENLFSGKLIVRRHARTRERGLSETRTSDQMEKIAVSLTSRVSQITIQD